MTEITEKKCNGCGRTKAADLFKRCSAALGGDGRRRNCITCEEKAKAERLATDEGGGATEEQLPEDAPRLIVGMALGFSAHWDGKDVVVTQTSGETQSTLWLSLHELDQLTLFRDQLHARLAAPAASPPVAEG